VSRKITVTFYLTKITRAKYEKKKKNVETSLTNKQIQKLQVINYFKSKKKMYVYFFLVLKKY